MFLRFFLPILLFFQPLTSLKAEIPSDGAIGIAVFALQSPYFRGAACKRIQRIVTSQDVPAISVLYGTFGFDEDCLKQIWDDSLAKGKQHITQIHFTSEVSRKNNFMGNNGFYPRISTREYNNLLEDMPLWLNFEIRTRVRRILRMVKGYENSGTFILGAGLEDQYTQLAYDNLHAVLREEWPFLISRNPSESTSEKINNMARKDFYELHHYNSGKLRTPCILNGDGQALSFAPDLTGADVQLKGIKRASKYEVAKWAQNGKRNGCVMFVWVSKWQGLHVARPAAPHNRVFRVDGKDVRNTKRLLRELNTGIRKGKGRRGGKKKKKRRGKRRR